MVIQKTSKVNNKEIVMRTWANRGIYDFFVAFDIENKHTKYSTFFCHQGLEKICKSYLLGKYSLEFEPFSEQEGLEKINKIAADKHKMGHGLKGMLDKLVSFKTLDENDIDQEYKCIDQKDRDSKVTCIEILEKSYLECRYPIPDPFYKRLPLKNIGKNIYEEPMGSSKLRKYSFSIGKKVIEKCEIEFQIKVINLERPSSKISGNEWQRFSNIFYGESCIS